MVHIDLSGKRALVMGVTMTAVHAIHPELHLQLRSLGATEGQIMRTVLSEARCGVIVGLVAGFGAALLADADQAISALGHGGRQGEHVVVVENTPETHNLVVCTLCSCYPWPLLGIPPGWYKSDSYRARAVREPRAVLAEFGVTLGAGTKVRVWDSTAEIRYLVLPMRPEGTGGMDEAALAGLVTRDSMIGTGLPAVAGAAT